MLVRSLLEDAGYRVIPFGVEDLLRELAILDVEKYRQLDLPIALKTHPDFFIADKELKQTWLLEVKYRQRWSDETRRKLAEKIIPQVDSWNPLYVMILLGESAYPKRQPEACHFIRVARLGMLDGQLSVIYPDQSLRKPWNSVGWGDLFRLQDVFPNLLYGASSGSILKAKKLVQCFKDFNFFNGGNQ